MCFYNRCHDNALNGFWALYDIVYDHVCLLHQIFPSFLTGNLLAHKRHAVCKFTESEVLRSRDHAQSRALPVRYLTDHALDQTSQTYPRLFIH
jgi:hypothetical protein